MIVPYAIAETRGLTGEALKRILKRRLVRRSYFSVTVHSLKSARLDFKLTVELNINILQDNNVTGDEGAEA